LDPLKKKKKRKQKTRSGFSSHNSTP